MTQHEAFRAVKAIAEHSADLSGAITSVAQTSGIARETVRDLYIAEVHEVCDRIGTVKPWNPNVNPRKYARVVAIHGDAG